MQNQALSLLIKMLYMPFIENILNIDGVTQ